MSRTGSDGVYWIFSMRHEDHKAGNRQINRSNGPKAVSKIAINEGKYASDVPLGR
jgi:hypothetical protein